MTNHPDPAHFPHDTAAEPPADGVEIITRPDLSHLAQQTRVGEHTSRTDVSMPAQPAHPARTRAAAMQLLVVTGAALLIVMLLLQACAPYVAGVFQNTVASL